MTVPANVKADHVLQGRIVSALTGQELSPTEVSLMLEADIRDVRSAGDELWADGLLVKEHHLDTEVWRLA